jgi:hypothetical protein
MFLDDQIMLDDMIGPCIAHAGDEKSVQNLYHKPENYIPEKT